MAAAVINRSDWPSPEETAEAFAGKMACLTQAINKGEDADTVILTIMAARDCFPREFPGWTLMNALLHLFSGSPDEALSEISEFFRQSEGLSGQGFEKLRKLAGHIQGWASGLKVELEAKKAGDPGPPAKPFSRRRGNGGR